MKIPQLFLTLSIFLLLLSSCDSGKEPSSPVKDMQSSASETMAEGEMTLVEGCSGCHGSATTNPKADTPFIAGQSANYLERAIRSYLIVDRKHEVMRQAIVDLDVSQRQELANYFANLNTPWKGGKDTRLAGALAPSPSAIRAGKAISTPCASCHGRDGNSIKAGVPSLAGLRPEYFIPAIKDYLSGVRRGAAIMKNFKLSLSQKDLDNLAAYYSVQQRKRSPLSTKLQKTVPSDVLVPRCVGCHGADGNSTHPAMPSLAGQNATYLIKAMKTYRDSKRRNKMMADVAKGLSDEEIERNAAYFSTRTPANVQDSSALTSQPEKFDPLGDGARLAASCNSCHGNKGNSASKGTPRLAGLDDVYLRQAISAYRDGQRKHSMMKMLTQYLSDTDIEKLSLYYATQAPEKSKRTLKNVDAKNGQGLASGCSGCHGEAGNSEDSKVPSLAGQDATYLVTAIQAYKEAGARNHEDMKNVAQELDNKSIRDLAQYYSRLTPDGEKPRALEGPDVLSKKCNRCHGENGGKPDPDKPRIAGQRQSYIVKALNGYKNGDRINSMMQTMSSELWLVEINAIAAYYAGK